MMKQLLRPSIVALAALTTLAGCYGEGKVETDAAAAGEPGSPAAAAAAGDTAATGGMAGMPGMSGSEGGSMTQQMQSHMKMMQGADGERIKTMLPEHRQMAANMIAGFNQEMKGMNMATDASWNATVDSLRQDLVRMPEMSADELQAFLPAHQARLDRLMASHGSMMGNMKM